MPLAYSPVSGDLLGDLPAKFRPKTAFVMRQLGEPPSLDTLINAHVVQGLEAVGLTSIDARDSIGGNDYLDRIVNLIRSTALSVAIFSSETRPESLANILLELGFAMLLGKPTFIAKSEGAKPPSDLKRTDWIEFRAAEPSEFDYYFRVALSGLNERRDYQLSRSEVFLAAANPDFAHSLEALVSGFLLSADRRFVEIAEEMLSRLDKIENGSSVADVERLRQEFGIFIRQADRYMKGSAIR